VKRLLAAAVTPIMKLLKEREFQGVHESSPGPPSTILGNVCPPEDIGRTAVWLASDASDYVNGTSLYIDGGMTLFPGFSTNG
jgi:NAD(P)-dependent dehydrogenase (short-subunit alcohol dehydrogenase family)